MKLARVLQTSVFLSCRILASSFDSYNDNQIKKYVKLSQLINLSLSLSFNTHTHTHTHIYIYIYIYIYIRKQVLVSTERYMCLLPKKSSCLSCVHQSNVHLPCTMTTSIISCLTSLSIFFRFFKSHYGKFIGDNSLSFPQEE